MEHLKALALTDIRVFGDWTKAPLGSILAMDGTHWGSVIAMRANYKSAGGAVILAGEHVGKMIGAGDFKGPALDLSALVEITAPQPAVSAYRSGARSRGTLVFQPAEASFYVWTETHPESGAGWVCVSAPKAARKTGEYFAALQTDDFVTIANLISVRQKEAAN